MLRGSKVAGSSASSLTGWMSEADMLPALHLSIHIIRSLQRSKVEGNLPIMVCDSSKRSRSRRWISVSCSGDRRGRKNAIPTENKMKVKLAFLTRSHVPKCLWCYACIFDVKFQFVFESSPLFLKAAKQW